MTVLTFFMLDNTFQKISKSPFSYAPMPYYFEGLTFAGIPRFVECADNYDYISVECQDVKVCTGRLTSFYDVISNIFPRENVVGTEGMSASVSAIREGLCNVLADIRYIVRE